MEASFGGNLIENGSCGLGRIGELEATEANDADAGALTVANRAGDNEVRVTTYATQASVTDSVMRDIAYTVRCLERKRSSRLERRATSASSVRAGRTAKFENKSWPDKAT